MLERAKLLHANGNYRMPNGSIEISDLRQKLQILIFSLFFTVASGFGLTGADSSVNRGNHLLCCRARAVPGCQASEGAAKEQRRAHNTLQERRPLRCCRFLPPRATGPGLAPARLQRQAHRAMRRRLLWCSRLGPRARGSVKGVCRDCVYDSQGLS